MKPSFPLFGLLLSCAGTLFASTEATLLTTRSVSAGSAHGLAVRSDGTVWAWGTNRIGELGLGNVTLVNAPRRITSLSGIQSVSAGPLHTLAVSASGQVWAWGTNGNGRLGTGNFVNTNAPAQVLVITNATGVAAGAHHSLAVLADGGVMAWGANNAGQLGTGNTTETNRPVQIGAFTNVLAVSAGTNHSLALTAGGDVWSWGANGQGQLGLGHNNNQLSPVKINSLSNIVAVAAGHNHSLAMDKTGKVFAWGQNTQGQLGLGNTSNSNAPTAVLNLGPGNVYGPAKGIAANFNSSVAIANNGKISYWGSYTNNATFHGTATQPIQIGGAVDQNFAMVTQGDGFLMASSDTGSVWGWGRNDLAQRGNGTRQTDYWRYEAVNPSFSFSARPEPSMVRFHRGSRTDLSYNSFVLPLDLQKGVQLNDVGVEQYCYSSAPWSLKTFKTLREHAWERVGATTNLTRFSIENPVVAFGSESGGSPLYTGQPYRFGVYAGAFNENSGQTNMIRVQVYNRASFTGGATGIKAANTFTISLPRRSISADNTAWSNFVTNGNRLVVETNGLRTVIEFADAPDAYHNWGVSMPFGAMANVVGGGYRITHTATSTDFYYVVEVLGSAQVGSNVLAPLVTAGGAWTYSPLYALGFENFPEWRSRYVDNPHYEGIPLPPVYAGRRLDELNAMTATATNQVALTNNSAYANLDTSPELRRHPVLDRFVTDMARDPLALASYVLNEIELTDPMAYQEASTRVADSIEVGGVNRSALGVFLEGQGSPTEQCALLVYLLRQAGYSAGYVFPTNSNLRLLDTTVSRLWQINVKGVVYHAGVPVITNSLIVVNYPWVVANIGTNTVHIFPWLKDTEIVEGPDIYDYMPTNYPSAYQWVKDYAHANPEVLGTASVNDPLTKVWREFLTSALNSNQLAQNLSLDEFGVRAFNRRNSYPTWDDLPKPNFLTNQTQLAIVPTLSENAQTNPFLTNMFDRIRIEVFKFNTNLVNRIFDTGLWRACDLHNRKLLLYTNTSSTVSLWMAPYRPDAINTTGDFTGFETGLGSLNRQIVTTSAGAETVYPIRVTYQRRPVTYPSPTTWYTMQELGLHSYDLTAQKRDVTAFCSSVGRVTPAMLRLHAEDYWRLERERSLNPSFVPAITEDAGTAAMMLGLSFFERLWSEDQFNQRLHKVRGLTWVSWGTAGLRRLNNDGMVVNMSMHWLNTLLLGNGRLRQDSGDRSALALDNYMTILQANGSSAEHAVIASLFGDANAVSSVRMLQLAAQRAQTNGWAPPLELNIKNYLSLGETPQTGYGTVKVKDQDAQLWQRITNAFATRWDASFLRVLMTPGAATNAPNTFKGSSALLFGKWQNGAILSDNQVVLNGGFSGNLTWIGSPSTQTYQLRYNLQHSPTIGFTFVLNNFSTPLPRYTFSHYDALTLTATSGVAQVAFTPHQTTQALLVASTLNLPSASTASATKTAKDVGWLGRASSLVKQMGSTLADPVHVISGDFYLDEVDLSLAGPLPLELRRNYLSRNLAENQFGHGWKLSFTPWLVLSTNSGGTSIIHAAEPDGSVIAYSFLSNNVWTVTPEHNLTLVNLTPDGIGSRANRFNDRIQRVTTNGTVYILSSSDGSKRFYQEMTSFGITSGTNTLPRVRPYLTRWEDHAGNHHLFHYGTNSADNDFGQLSRVEGANGSGLVFKYDFHGRIVEALAHDGRRIRYAYDTYGDLISVTLPDDARYEYEYQRYTFSSNSQAYVDSNHLLINETRPDGRVLVNTYDGFRRVTTQAASVGTNRELVINARFFYTNNVNSLTNDLIHGVTRVEDVFGNPHFFDYTNSFITRVIEPLGRTNIQDWFEATESNKPGYYPRSLEMFIDVRGLTNEFRYDAQGNVTNRIVRGDLTGDGGSQTVTITFTYTNNLPATVLDPAGNHIAVFYEDSSDAFRPTRIEWSNGGTGIATNRISYTNVTQVVDMGGWLRTNRAFGLPSRLIRADVATNEWSYDGRGFITQSVRYARTADNPANNDPAVTNYFTHTARGDVLEARDAAGRRIRMSHDMRGRLQWRDVMDQQGTVVARENMYYNRNGELEWYDGPRSGPDDLIWFDYDGAGRRVQEVRWGSRAKRDASGVEEQPGDLLYATTHYKYDYFGNLTRIVDPRGAITTNTWDAMGRLVQQQFFDTNSSTLLSAQGFSYEPCGQIRFHTNALSGVSEFQYTATGQPMFRKGADGATNAWRYYADGRLRREILRNGAYWETVYDDANRRVTRTFHSSAGVAQATNIFEFDRRGNLIRHVDAGGNGFTNSYDGLGRLKFSLGPRIANEPPPGLPLLGSPPPPVQQTITNFYEAAGIVVTNINAIGERTITYFDILGRVTRKEIRSSANELVNEASIEYAPDHHSFTVTRGSGTNAIISKTFTDNEGRPVLSFGYPNTGVRHFTLYDYDAAGNPLFEGRYSETNGTRTLWHSAVSEYDGLNRLRKEWNRDNALTVYSYNGAGGLTNRVMPGGLQWRAEYNTAGRITREFNLASGNSGTRTNTYTYYASNTAFAGLLNTHTDGRGVVRTNLYDVWLRPATNVYSGALNEHKLTTVTQYDVRGYATNITESFLNSSTGPSTSVRRVFDPYGLLKSEFVVVSGDTHSSASQSWNSAGRRTDLTGTFGYGFAWRADGLLANVWSSGVSGSYGYTTAGLPAERTINSLKVNITARDGMGRVLARETRLNSVLRLTEGLTWTGDGLLSAHQLIKSGYDYDSRSYEYTDASRRLIAEGLMMNATTGWTNVFEYDAGVPSGAGVLTGMAEPHTGGAAWTATMDIFNRLEHETNNVIRRLADGRMNAVTAIGHAIVTLNGRPLPLTVLSTGGTNWPTEWQTTMELRPGVHALQATAVHSSGQFTTNRSITFTNNAVDQTTLSHFQEGQLSHRVWKNSLGQTNRVQTFVWDGRSRLLGMTEIDASNNGYEMRAVYDAFGRRLRTETIVIIHNVALTNQPKVIQSYFDPEVEFLELGVRTEGKTTWKIQGPDLDGRYGGMNGTGGLDGLVDSVGIFRAVISDARGDVLARHEPTDGTVQWNSSRPTGYGAVPEYRPIALAHNSDIAASSAWRGRWPDLSGLYWLGARYYDPVAGRFISCDPLGHDADPSLYSFANGDPINYFDPDGRLGKQYNDFSYNGGFSGYALRHTADIFNQAASTSSTAWNYQMLNSATAFSMAAGAITPRTYVEGYHSGVDRAANVMAGEMVNGSGMTWSVLQGTSSIVGDAVGYNSIMEGGFGVDRQTGELLDGVDRTSRTLMGSSQVILTGVGVRASYRPTIESPPVIPSATPSKVTPRVLTDAEKALYGRVSSRPRGFREQVWERAKAPDGNVYDPSGRMLKFDEPWELGHRPEHKFSKAQLRAAQEGWDRQTWIRYQNDPDIYRPELPSSNASHRWE
jgi:RHS repeat-associated protein